MYKYIVYSMQYVGDDERRVYGSSICIRDEFSIFLDFCLQKSRQKSDFRCRTSDVGQFRVKNLSSRSTTQRTRTLGICRQRKLEIVIGAAHFNFVQYEAPHFRVQLVRFRCHFRSVNAPGCFFGRDGCIL